MRLPKTLVLLAAGAALGAALIVACSDDSPHDADAAVCDCPAAEPPLAGRIVSMKSSPVTIAPNGAGQAGAGCPAGATILGGGCGLSTADTGLSLIVAEINRGTPTNPAYLCAWVSTSPTERTGTAEAICLVPAQ